VRVPAVLVSPWVPRGTVVPSTRVFEHASIPATVTEFFIGAYDDRTEREKQSGLFSTSFRCRMRSGGFLFADK
jgi:phospholipase C